MIVLAGGDVVLPDRLLANASVVIDDGRIAAIDPRPRLDPSDAEVIDAAGCYVVPGFVDVHVHGVDGFDTFGERGSIAAMAARLPRYGVTAFCPTTVACGPDDLAHVLADARAARAAAAPGAARVLPAHLESNFISPAYRGAQPAMCLRLPHAAGDSRGGTGFGAADILAVIDAFAREVGIVTLAPELPGALDLVRRWTAAGHRVALGHSGADYDTALAAFEAGACHATHLFNRMPPMSHRAPGLVGAVLGRNDVAAELICDGFHVHPAMARLAIEARHARGVLAITDGTSVSGLPVGATGRLGAQAIVAGPEAAWLDEGERTTLAGSTLTMDRAFATVVRRVGCSVVDAARLCATNPAEAIGLVDAGRIAEDMRADVTLLDRDFRVRRTWVGGAVAPS